MEIIKLYLQLFYDLPSLEDVISVVMSLLAANKGGVSVYFPSNRLLHQSIFRVIWLPLFFWYWCNFFSYNRSSICHVLNIWCYMYHFFSYSYYFLCYIQYFPCSALNFSPLVSHSTSTHRYFKVFLPLSHYCTIALLHYKIIWIRGQVFQANTE